MFLASKVVFLLELHWNRFSSVLPGFTYEVPDAAGFLGEEKSIMREPDL